MTGAPIVDDDAELITEPSAKLNEWVGQLMSEQIGSSVYAAHWQIRSGFLVRQGEFSARTRCMALKQDEMDNWVRVFEGG